MLLFSIIVPIYKVEKFLRNCIDSILEQTVKDFELILVDDGSPDNCAEICDEYAEKDERIKVIHKTNGGLVSARNIGVKHAIGEYILYVDGDDWVSRNWLYSIKEVIQKFNPDMISFNAYKSIDGNNEKLKTSNFYGYFDRKSIEEKIIPNALYDERKSFFSFGVLPAVWAKAFKAEVLKNNICKDEKITFGEDVACTYNCILASNSFVGIRECLYYYRQNTESMTKSYDKSRFNRLKYLFRYLETELVTKEYELEKQYEYYRVFCICYAILNEAKCKKKGYFVKKQCNDKMKEYKFQNVVDEFSGKNLGLLWSLYLFFIKKRMYGLLACIGKMICKIVYSYKE